MNENVKYQLRMAMQKSCYLYGSDGRVSIEVRLLDELLDALDEAEIPSHEELTYAELQEVNRELEERLEELEEQNVKRETKPVGVDAKSGRTSAGSRKTRARSSVNPTSSRRSSAEPGDA